jgi:hypothetical protein
MEEKTKVVATHLHDTGDIFYSKVWNGWLLIQIGFVMT